MRISHILISDVLEMQSDTIMIVYIEVVFPHMMLLQLAELHTSLIKQIHNI